MFQDVETEVIGFESRPETERLVNDKSSQTAELKTSDQKTQTVGAHSVASQSSNDTINLSNPHPYDVERLSQFLKKILPHLEEELKTNGSNSGELNFNENYNDENFGEDGEQKLTQPCTQKIITPEFCKEKIISDLSWNSSDVVLAVSCSEKSHTSWCCHETTVCIYNTGKAQYEKNEPTELLQVSSCVRCIKFHSRLPSLLAGGLYNGEVIIWDLRHDDTSLINNKGSGDEAAHVDVITFLTWRENENGLWLVSAGRDGRIILWKVTTTNLSYEIHERFLILKQHLTSTAGPREHVEIVHMDFKSSESFHFVAACGHGTVFYCSMTTARSLTALPQYKDPVLRSYKPRQGIVTRVSCHSDLFASSGTDSEIHIYKYEQEAPVLKIHTGYKMLVGIQWISSKEIMSWGDSKVSYYRIQKPSEENLICDVEGGVSTAAFKTSSVKQSGKLAIGSQMGSVIIFNNWTTSA